ncbi:hypothetical protein Ping_1521 [Psychromonas ingrahamii 37]|uniref:Fibronectin type-III domain-containing protein n=1 Tax=Psychromonas ingrahamii (strain DSM 17664 / CCUG 51855 / 37) TaxID=357804 RepID=A1SV17_PSYIN|nr:fibronectin type III domain-containing protein [Psychromonas ingrahamii]ABM03332.1 hypothetical protein Ping_1521 [Psychromonas ingrahamii 37]
MNQRVNLIYNRLILIFLLVISPAVLSASLQITWSDNSSNEDGFLVEKRLLNEDKIQNIAILPVNSQEYNDLDLVSNETYCYRITAFNKAGMGKSDEFCYQVPTDFITDEDTAANQVTAVDQVIAADQDTAAEQGISSVKFTGKVVLSHEIIAQVVDLEIGEKTLYSFKSDLAYNQEYTKDTLNNSSFTANVGEIRYSNEDYFSFQNQGVEIDNGYASMAFNSNNSLSFVLQGTGNKQTARLYMQAGVWSDEQSNIIVTAGDQVEVITLPNGYAWHSFAIDIVFDGTVPVHIATESDRSGYSTVMFAGIVFDKENLEKNTSVASPVFNYAAFVDIDTNFGAVIDTTDVTFYTAKAIKDNGQLSNASLQNLSFYGEQIYRDDIYSVINDGAEINSGYQSMSWNEANGAEIKLESADQQINTASVYFIAAVWSYDAAFVELVINGESELIEVPSGYGWHSMKVDIEFEGIVDINIHPVGEFGGYSGFGVAGITVQ